MSAPSTIEGSANKPLFLSLRARRNLGRAGFSLIEVVIAVGIVAFAFIPLLGLMPLGLKTSGQAIDATVAAEIIQQMTGQAQQANFSSLAQLNSTTILYFDSNGNSTTASAAMYKAAFSVPTTTNSSGATVPVATPLPGGSTTSQLATITIYILSTRTAGGMAAQSTADLQGNSASKKYTVFLANNGL